MGSLGSLGVVSYDIVAHDMTAAGRKGAQQGIDKSMLVIGAAMTGVGLACASMVDKINDSYLSFDSAIAEVKSLGGVTQDQMDAIRETSIELSKELPISATEIAEGFYMLRSAGYDAEIAIGAIPDVARMAAAGGLDMAQAVNAITAVMDAYGDEAGDTAHVTDVLMGTVQAFKTTLPELQTEMSKNIGVAATLGISFEELSAMNGMLKKDFVSSEEAGTALKTMLLRLADATNIEKMEKLGISVKDSEGNFVGMESLLNQVSDAMNNAGGDVEQMSMLTSIFGTEGVRAAMSLTRQKDAMGEYVDSLQEGGQVQESLNAIIESTASQLTIAENKMEAARIELGEAMAPATIAVADAMTIFAGVLEGLPDSLQGVVGVGLQAGQMFVGLGPLLMGLSMVQIPSLSGAMTFLSANPIVLVIAGVAALVIGLMYLESEFGLVSAAIDWVVGAISGAIDWLFSLVDSFTSTGEESAGFGDALILLLGPIGGIIYAFQHWDEILEIVTGVFNDVMSFIDGAIDWMLDAGGRIMQAFIDGMLALAFGPADIVSDALGFVGDLIPHSPAKKGPLSKLPNWDAYLVDPIRESGEKMGAVSSEMVGRTSRAIGGNTNISYGGDTLSIDTYNVNQNADTDYLFSAWNRHKRAERVRRGVRG